MLLRFVKNRTSNVVTMYSLYLYFFGSRNTFIDYPCLKTTIGYVSVCIWVQNFGHYNPYRLKRISDFITDVFKIQICDGPCFLLVSIVPVHKTTFVIHISQARKILELSSFLDIFSSKNL